MFGHRICSKCNKVGHKRDMVGTSECVHGGIDPLIVNRYYHESCYIKKFKVRKCECGKHWIVKKK
jgi:hypothetical protein